jgi:biotin carboxylase
LDEIVVKGVKTTIPFQQRILSHKNFIEGKYDTGFVENVLQNIPKNSSKESGK